ncbi:TPA: hypothetical protein ACTW94_005324 [Raoultella ornithinolytica]|uniref:hypothetical protein n=1 Tax=Klebsiella pneumoniae TaxID=573 RepID=UPI001BA59F56|nr:hypothetical protein [Klebsiella pneumoniae]MBS2827049.1 hypothetical protein [Klebsiella pneumoniae]
MPEKVTSLNGLKVTLEYGSYNTGAHNKDYVKSKNKRHKNQYFDEVACYFPTPATSHGSFRNRVLS